MSDEKYDHIPPDEQEWEAVSYQYGEYRVFAFRKRGNCGERNAVYHLVFKIGKVDVADIMKEDDNEWT